MLPFALSMVVGPCLGARIGRYATGPTSTLLTAVAAPSGEFSWVAFGMVVTGLGAGVLNGDTQKAIMACVLSHRTGMASGISTTTRFTAIVTSIGVLGAALSSRARTAIDVATLCHSSGKACVDAQFMMELLAGDIGHALSGFAPGFQPAMRSIASASLASGFASALNVAGILALVISVAIWQLAKLSRPT